MRLIDSCVLIGCLLALASTLWAVEPKSSQDVLLESFFREYLEAAVRLEPMMATPWATTDSTISSTIFRRPRASRESITIGRRSTISRGGSATKNSAQALGSITTSFAITLSERSG